ncbi:hypothetical protein L345_00063, partial [Ophiophagus hannah]
MKQRTSLPRSPTRLIDILHAFYYSTGIRAVTLLKGFITTFSQIAGQYYTWFSPNLSWTADMIRWDRTFSDHTQYTCPTCTEGHGY